METKTTRYHTAFRQFLRKGTPMYRALKADHPTPYYVWHTRGDSKVRSSHAANNGKIFAWDNPPPTGNPGEDFGCRCRAEPYHGIVERALNGASDKLVDVLNYFNDILTHVEKWDNRHMIAYFYVGRGRAVTLEGIGQLQDTKLYYERSYYKRFLNQIKNNASFREDGPFSDEFTNSYNFRPVLYSFGDSTISGVFEGKIKTYVTGRRALLGRVRIKFSDEFTDPFNVIDTALPFIGIYSPPDWVKLLADVAGAKYAITGEWEEDVFLSF